MGLHGQQQVSRHRGASDWAITDEKMKKDTWHDLRLMPKSTVLSQTDQVLTAGARESRLQQRRIRSSWGR